jgi:ribonuclease HI
MEVAYIDGSGVGRYGFLVLPSNEVHIYSDYPCTNNEAEWLALYSLILFLPDKWEGKVYSDSQIVAYGWTGEYQVHKAELQEIYKKCKFMANLKELKLHMGWIPREQNLIGKKLDTLLARDRKKRCRARKTLSSRRYT